MIYPNKNIQFKESILNKMLPILTYRSYGSIEVSELYKLVIDDFDSIDQFILSLDVLFALDAIDLDEGNEKVIYAI